VKAKRGGRDRNEEGTNAALKTRRHFSPTCLGGDGVAGTPEEGTEQDIAHEGGGRLFCGPGGKVLLRQQQGREGGHPCQ